MQTFFMTRGKDTIEVTILDDGRVKTTVAGSISAPNHTSAEKAIAAIEADLGGPTEVEHLRPIGHTHTHAGGITHSH